MWFHIGDLYSEHYLLDWLFDMFLFNPDFCSTTSWWSTWLWNQRRTDYCIDKRSQLFCTPTVWRSKLIRVPLQYMISLIVLALQFLVQISGVAPMLNTDTKKGISGDDSDLMARQNAFGSNTYPRKKGRSLLVCWGFFISHEFFPPISLWYSGSLGTWILTHVVFLLLFRLLYGMHVKTWHLSSSWLRLLFHLPWA
jgi:hypothetical protein